MLIPLSFTASAWKRCAKTDSKLDECLREAVHVAIKELSEKGAKDFGVFPIDPLFMSQVNIEQGRGPVAIDLRFRDLNIHGLKNAKLIDVVKSDLDKYTFKTRVRVEEGVTLRGYYKVDGKVLVLPINGDGKCELSLANVTADVELYGKELIKDGQKYAQIENFKFSLDTTRLRMQLDNLFNGNKELSTQMNKFLNENWSEILQELKPAIQDAFGSAFREITNRIFIKVPYDNLFL
ncbi:hypothetical protein ONE63_000092 [Megalurothrips usitatus]|uniref:Protein takeout n=1 Tax=Megalurothrips usitatus TaxID=439358 RepID=A0AAV7XY19_9NEOP|nr:hypothetical protein ONE63_000092 [Megalurothrips usitatus]